jgi:2-keto-4-pentenoate hydratase/2-oxohepta-3-ene-1,7-dioic acid hydratase in catechol pathway
MERLFTIALSRHIDYMVSMEAREAGRMAQFNSGGLLQSRRGPAVNTPALCRAKAAATGRLEIMATNLVRFESDDAVRWGVASAAAGIAPLTGEYPTTAALIEQGEADWRGAQGQATSLPMGSVKILSPITVPCRLFCQGANYRQHMVESGMNPDEKLFNMFFTKADASVISAHGSVERPRHVKLLDYEIELALVFRRPITSAVTVTNDTLKDYVFAITIANDLSARDVQLPQMQFFKGKSYRGFCPLGPWLTILEPEEFLYLDALELQLSVNGTIRQRDTTKNLVFKPAETISELSNFANVAVGDVLLTGTPSGCALRVPPAPIRRVLQLLPERQFWNLFAKAQSRRPQYLQQGDKINARIWSADGRIDLGEQTTAVVR